MQVFHKNIDYFLRITESGSFNEAALRMDISQSALSTAIINLEAELGFSVLKRDHRGVSLTPRGKALYDLVHKQKKDFADQLGSKFGKGFQYPLKFGIRESTFYDSVYPRISRLLNEFPDLQLYVLPSKELLPAVELGHLDLALLGTADIPRGNLEYERYSEVDINFVGLKSKFAEIARAKTIAELEPYPWIHVGIAVAHEWHQTLATTNRGFVVSSLESFRKLVLGGYGIGEADSDYFSSNEKKRLVSSKVPTGLSKGKVGFVYRQRASGYIQDRIHALIKNLKAR